MNLRNETLTVFDSEVLLKSVIEDVELYIFANRLNYIYVPAFQRITMSVAQQLRSIIMEFYAERQVDFCNVIEFELNGELDPEARAWAAKRPDDVTSLADAVITKDSMAHRMLANFYMKVNRPKKPTRFFKSSKEAVEWSIEQLRISTT